MSVYVTTWAWEHAPDDLTSGQMLVLLAVADHAGPDGTEAWPTIARLAAMSRLSESAVQRALKELVARGLLLREINAGGTRGQRADRRPSLFTVVMDGVASTRPGAAHGVASTRLRGGVHAAQTVLTPPEDQNPPLPTVAAPADPAVSFEEFWALYPRHVGGRLAAAKAWDKACKIASAEVILAAVRLFAASVVGAEPRFIPYPTTWLNAGRWADDVAVRRKTADGGTRWVGEVRY